MYSFLESFSQRSDTRTFPTAGREYKSAIRALIPLLHSSGDADQVVKLAAMEEAIPRSNGRAWRTIKEKLQHGKISALEDLDEKTRTLAQFTRVNSYVHRTEFGWLTAADAGFFYQRWREASREVLRRRLPYSGSAQNKREADSCAKDGLTVFRGKPESASVL